MLTALLLYLFGLLVLWHFVIEGIIAPSTRATIRLRLFALRDELRRLRLNGAATEDEFEEAQRIINNTIRLAPSIDAFMLVQWEMKLKADKEFAERVERRRLNFEKTASEEVKKLVKKAYMIGGDAVRVNSMGWVVYLVPLFIGVAIWKRISREVTNMTSATEHEWSSGEACPA
jgi:hypothetical protein